MGNGAAAGGTWRRSIGIRSVRRASDGPIGHTGLMGLMVGPHVECRDLKSYQNASFMIWSSVHVAMQMEVSAAP